MATHGQASAELSVEKLLTELCLTPYVALSLTLGYVTIERDVPH